MWLFRINIFIFGTLTSYILKFNQKFFLGFGIGVLLRDSGKISIKLSVGKKLLHVGISLLLSLIVENIKISNSSMFYVVGFLKFTAMMVGVVYVIPWLLSRNKAKDLWWNICLMYTTCLLGFNLNALKIWLYLIEIHFIKKLAMLKLNSHVIVILFLMNTVQCIV